MEDIQTNTSEWPTEKQYLVQLYNSDRLIAAQMGKAFFRFYMTGELYPADDPEGAYRTVVLPFPFETVPNTRARFILNEANEPLRFSVDTVSESMYFPMKDVERSLIAQMLFEKYQEREMASSGIRSAAGALKELMELLKPLGSCSDPDCATCKEMGLTPG